MQNEDHLLPQRLPQLSLAFPDRENQIVRASITVKGFIL